MHHPMPLFHMEHCVIAALLSEGRDYRDLRPSLREAPRRACATAPGWSTRSRPTSAAGTPSSTRRPQSAGQRRPRARRSAGVRRFRIELVRETAADVGRLVGAYRALLDGTRERARASGRTLQTEGGYGVVTGSLRVLAPYA